MKYHYGTLNPAYTFDILSLVILQLSTFDQKCVLYKMPDFVPNEYLYKTHTKKGQDRWEVYAWAVRDAMIKCG